MKNEDTYLLMKRIADHKITHEILKCPKPDCGSLDVWKYGFQYENGKKYQKYKCKKCGYVWVEKNE